ncbi:MAG: hypothetical protein WBW73_06335 [Rhodoplanes sp.]
MPKKKSKAGNGVRLHDVSDAPLTEAEIIWLLGSVADKLVHSEREWAASLIDYFEEDGEFVTAAMEARARAGRTRAKAGEDEALPALRWPRRRSGSDVRQRGRVRQGAIQVTSHGGATPRESGQRAHQAVGRQK